MTEESTDLRPEFGRAGATPAKALSDRVLAGLRGSFARQRRLAERALEQIDDASFLTPLGGADGNSPAILVKHLGGNLRSRFTDFLTTDGEKPDRHRDQEFVIDPDTDDRADLMRRWALGWSRLEDAVATLDDAAPEGVAAAAAVEGTTVEGRGLLATVTIRSEPYAVIEALLRAHDHVAYHVGQIVLLARMACGDDWQSLSIPRGGSRAYLASVEAGLVSQRDVTPGAGEDS